MWENVLKNVCLLVFTGFGKGEKLGLEANMSWSGAIQCLFY